MKRRNDSKNLGFAKAAVRELKPADFERIGGAALSDSSGSISPIAPIGQVIPVITIGGI